VVSRGIWLLDALWRSPSYTPTFSAPVLATRVDLPFLLQFMKFRLFLRVALALFTMLLTMPRSHGQQPQAPVAPIVRSIDVQFAGAAKISREKIVANMRTRVGRPYSEAVVEDDIRNLYSTGNVSNVRIFGEPTRDGVKVIVVIAAKAQISEVVLNGPDQVKASRIRKEISAKPGDQLSEASLEQDRQKIIEYYANKGFGDVNVTYDTAVNEKAGTARVTFTVTEGGKTIIDNVHIQGNSQVKTGDIRKVIKTRPKSAVNPLTYFSKRNRLSNDQLEADAAAVRELYQNRGYADVQVGAPRVERSSGGKVDVTFSINEGAQYRVGRVTYSGAQVLAQDELSKDAKVRSGEVYSPAAIRADVKNIQDQYGSRGYIDFNAGAQTRRAGAGTMDVAFTVEEGVQSYVEKINISGNTRTKDKVIRREIALTPGEVYNTVRVDASKARLNNLNYFSKVEMYPSDTLVPGRKDLNVNVEEKRTGSFNFGAGFSSIDSLLGFVEVTQGNFDMLRWPNFTGGGQKFRIRAQYGTRRKDFILALTEPYFMDRELSLGGELFYREASFVSSVYDEKRVGGAITARKRLGTFTSGRLGYRLENISIENIDEDVSDEIRNEEGTRLKSEISAGVLYDTRDSVFLTRKGERIDFSAFIAGGFLGGDTDIYGWDLEASKYFLLPWDTILTLNGELASVSTWGDGDRVPIFDRLYLGGANNLRGFRYRDVGPKDEDGEPIGGNSLWRLTVEYTFPIVDKVRGAVFYDVGAVGTGSYDFGGDVNSDVGIGVRLDLPIGPVRIDYGIPIQADEFNDSSGKFQFNIGYQF
jgi:outer membrane protein insertion porin family